jgi:hypothetical protein
MQPEHFGDVALRQPRELARLLQAFRDLAALGGIDFGHAAAAFFSLCFLSRPQTNAAVSSMERGSFVVSSTKMFTSFGID